MKLEISTNARSVAVAYEQAPKLLAATLFKRLKSVRSRLVRSVRRKLDGQMLNRVSGRLHRAVSSRIETDQAGQGALVRVFDKAWYATSQHDGGTIRPRRGSMLAIPVGEARTPDGDSKFRARTFLEAPAAFGFRTGFIHGNVILGKRGEGNQEAIVPLFVLKPAVLLRPRPFLKDALSDQRAGIEKDLFGAVQETTATLGKAGVGAVGGRFL